MIQPKKSWYWTLLIFELALLALLLLILYAIFMAMAAMAAGITTWPLLVAFVLIVIVSSTGMAVSSRHPSLGLRRLGFATHATAACLCLILAAIIGWSWLHAFRRRFPLPSGFQGEAYILHSMAGTAPEKSWWRTTYRVPADGILVTTDPALVGGQSFNDEFDYVERGGRLHEIPDAGPGTLPDTPENRNDNTRTYSYFLRSGSGSTSDGCAYELDEITIGTKAFVLSKRREIGIGVAPWGETNR